MPITVPNIGVNKSTSGGILDVTVVSPTTGSKLLVCSSGFQNLTSISTGTNGGGVSAWTSLAAFSGDVNHNDQDIWIGTVGATPATNVRLNFTSTSWMAAFVLELAGAQQVIDVTTAFANDIQSASDSKSHTTTIDGDIIVSVVGVSGSTVATIPTGYTTAGANQNDASSNMLAVAYLIQSVKGASTMNWSAFTNTSAWPSLGAVSIQAASAVVGYNPIAPSYPASRFGPF